MSHKRYFISACLLGQKVRYDGKDCLVSQLVQALLDKDYVSLCPEVSAGLPTPRPAAEIRHGSGADVLLGHAQVFSSDGHQISDVFIQGAYKALALAQANHVTHAVLKANSPSCGSDGIYDGSFTGQKIAGEGITAALFRQHGIHVVTEQQFLVELTQTKLTDEPN